MIEFLKGKLSESGPGWVIIEKNGVGIRLDVPNSRDHAGPNLLNEEVLLFTRLIVKEEGLYIYGFKTAEERNLFNLILGVSGYGPRLALSVLGRVSVTEFYVAVLEEDLQVLLKIPGIGRKTAQRLILELKEKLPAAVPAAGNAVAAYSPEAEAVEALSSLGYSRVEAARAVEKTKPAGEEPISVESLLKNALKNLGSR